jgi:hypothetical protein
MSRPQKYRRVSSVPEVTYFRPVGGRGADGYFPSDISADTGIGRWVFGSITDKVLHAGDTPVLIVRPRENENFEKGGSGDGNKSLCVD